MNTYGLLPAVVWLSATALTNASQAQSPLSVVSAFAQRIGEAFAGGGALVRRISGDSSPFLITSGSKIFVVDADATYVMSCQNSALDVSLRRASGSAGTFYTTDDLAWQRASQIVDPLILGRGMYRYRLLKRGFGLTVREDLRGRVTFQWEARPFGVRTKLCGNHVTIDLDARTGAVVTYSARFDYTYLQPSGNVTPEQALAVAKGAVSAHAQSQDFSNPRIVKQFLPANGFYSSTLGAQYSTEKKLPYGYSVTFKKWVVFVTDRGVVVGGGRTK